MTDFALALGMVKASPDHRVLTRLVPIDEYPPLPAGHGAVNLLIVDVETTGLDHSVDEITELAMLLVQVGTTTGLPAGRVQALNQLQEPSVPITPGVTALTGIDQALVAGHQIDDQAVGDMVAQADLIVAHNAAFDRPFLEARFPVFTGKAWACSFKEVVWNEPSLKLGMLAYTRLGVFFDAHRALVDCHALLQVLCTKMLDGHTAITHLFKAACKVECRIDAVGASYDHKDDLKARGYKFNAEAKLWFTKVDESAVDEEVAWLKAEVYGRKRATLPVVRETAFNRWSKRAPTNRYEIVV